MPASSWASPTTWASWTSCEALDRLDSSASSRPPLSISGFLGAASSAPGLAVIICFAGVLTGAGASSGATSDQIASGIFGMFFMFVIATIWGVAPSLAFGGAVLAVMQRLPWRRRPGRVAYMVGGLVAAALYAVSALAVASVSQGAAMFFAPWATTEFIGSAGSWWLVASIVVSGAAAGLLYGLCVKRG